MSAGHTPVQAHRRHNPLTGAWVLVSPQRNQRPWLGGVESRQEAPQFRHDPSCYLCPGNLRASGERNPGYTGPFVFKNDFPALTGAVADGNLCEPAAATDSHFFRHDPATGVCRVICFSEDHAKTLPDLTRPEMEAVIATWCAQSRELGADHAWVQVFENKGAAMGCSNPHPHSQVWASHHVPTEALTEDRLQRAYHAQHGRAMLLDYARAEAPLIGTETSRTVLRTAHWLAVVPYWASWPFEVLLLPLRPVQRMGALVPALQQDLAHALLDLTQRYDALFDCSFPYSMGWHGAPTGPDHREADSPHWQLHAHFYPPLMRSASVRKFMVGYEMLAEAQRDMTPELAARLLREQRVRRVL